MIEPDGDLPVIAAAHGDRGISRNVSHAVEASYELPKSLFQKSPWLVHPTPSGPEILGIFVVLIDAGGIRIWRRKAEGGQGPPRGLIDPIFYINIS